MMITTVTAEIQFSCHTFLQSVVASSQDLGNWISQLHGLVLRHQNEQTAGFVVMVPWLLQHPEHKTEISPSQNAAWIESIQQTTMRSGLNRMMRTLPLLRKSIAVRQGRLNVASFSSI